MTSVSFDRLAQRIDYCVASGCFSQEFHMLHPRNRDQNSNAGGGAPIQEPGRRRVINPHQINTEFLHQMQIALKLLRRTEIVALRVRSKWPVSYSFDEKFFLPVEEEFGDGADTRICSHWALT